MCIKFQRQKSRPMLSDILEAIPTNNLENKIELKSIHVSCSRRGSYTVVCINLQHFSFLKASFSALDCQRICDSSSRTLFVDEDDCGGASALGDGTSTCMLEFSMEDELLNEWDDHKWVAFPLKAFHIRQN